jgi:hypothetical protein
MLWSFSYRQQYISIKDGVQSGRMQKHAVKRYVCTDLYTIRYTARRDGHIYMLTIRQTGQRKVNAVGNTTEIIQKHRNEIGAPTERANVRTKNSSESESADGLRPTQTNSEPKSIADVRASKLRGFLHRC